MKVIIKKYDVHLQNHIDSLRLMMKTFRMRFYYQRHLKLRGGLNDLHINIDDLN